MKLICFPYAGGNKHSYNNLKPYIDSEIEFIAMELPGRGAKFSENLVANLEDLANELYKEIRFFELQNYMFFGHSMGGLLGNLLIHKLNRDQKCLPKHFLVTGCRAPNQFYLKQHIHNLSITDLKKTVTKLGGMPKEALANKEIMEYISPILRSDFKAIETHSYKKQTAYNVPITVISGTEEGISDALISDWKNETSSDFKKLYLSGGHFFINNNLNLIGDFINSKFKKAKTYSPWI